MDATELKFGGLAYEIAEGELGGSFGEDDGGRFIRRLYAEYGAEAGRPEMAAWLRRRLPEVFAAASARPAWVEQAPMWPFLGDAPMTFIGQMTVPNNEKTNTRLSPGCELYVFGSRVTNEYGWEMTYRVIQQLRDLP